MKDFQPFTTIFLLEEMLYCISMCKCALFYKKEYRYLLLEDDMSSNRKSKKVRILNCLIVILIISMLVFLYFGIAIFFKTHFFPNTIINGIDCSYKDMTVVNDMLRKQSREYKLDVIDFEDNTIGEILAQDINLKIDVVEDIQALLNGQNSTTWVVHISAEKSYDIIYGVDFDEKAVKDMISSWDVMKYKNMIKPIDACISEYMPERKGYEIIPEERGSLLDRSLVEKFILEAIQEGDALVNLEESNCYVLPKITTTDFTLNKRLEILNKWTGTYICFDWNGKEVILDGDTINEWIYDDNGMISIDEEAVSNFVIENAKANDTYGRRRSFTTALGETLHLPSGAFGWKTSCNEEAAKVLELIQSGTTISREPIYSMRGAAKGENDIGKSYVECDLSNQHLYLVIDGEIELETDFVSGKMSKSDCVTPPGVFGLTYKTLNAVLRGEDYETPVKYWMPFNGNIGMHDANWRRSFGGDIYLTGGSHGCVNLPPSKAAEIYEYMSPGFPVICYYY